MSVRRRQNFLGQQRVDAPHLKSIESAVSNDFDELIQGLVIGENKSYVIRGLEINMPGSIGASASGLQLLVENSAILHGASNESGTFYTIPAGTTPEVLSSTTNDRVDGAFTPNTDNYVGLEFIRSVDDSTTDQVNFWNPTSNVEFSKTVPLAVTLDYKIVITTSSFASNVLPIAIVQTNGSNNVISITDRRALLYRLGVAGDQNPDPFYQYPWADGRVENFYTSTSSTANPFLGGDKQITTMKDFFDALMTEFKLLKGTPFWYSTSAGSISRLRQDIANTAFTGKGNVIHGAFDFQGLVTGMTTNVIIKTVDASASGAITLVVDGINNINTLISTHNSANPTSQIYLYSGNGAQVPSVNIILTSKSGQVNWSDELYLNFIGGRLRYAILKNEASDDIILSNNQVAYLELVRGVSIIPNLVFTQNGTVVTSVGLVNWTSDLQAGDFIKDASKGDEFYYEIASVTSLSEVTIATPFLETSSGPAGFDAQYAFGVYETSPAPSSERHVQIADRGSVPFGEGYFWLFYRQDDTGSVAKIYARVLGGQELQQGEWQDISDNTSKAILQYIGSPSESDVDPDYTNALGVTRSNIHLLDGENLTKSLKRLEQRNDVVPRVRAIDLVSTSLPAGASVTIDSETLANGDYVLFVNSPIEGLYKVSGVGAAVAFEKMYAFGGLQQPVDGDLIRVEAGTTYLRTIWKRASSTWKPMEVQDAAKEPTGFPNRTDSEISFDNVSRTLSISPKSPATHFDVFTKGRIFRFESTQQVTIPNTEGVYFFYFNTSGVLAYSTVFSLNILTENIYVANAYWSVSQAKVVLFGDERHGITMDGATHEYLHNKNGAVITGGGAINFASAPTGGVDGDAEITLGNIVFRDEDIRMDITNSASPSNIFEQILDPIAEIPVLYRDGAAGDWKKDVATPFPVKQGSSRIQFNQYSLGAWSQVDAQEGYYVSMWVFATNNFSEPVVAILGQAEHATLSEAQADDSYDSLSFGTMPAQEYKVLYRIIFQTSSAFVNTPKAAVFDVRDLRSSVDTQFAQVAPNDHGLLSGLADPDHAPTAVTTAGVTKDGGLSSSDIDLQQSLDTLNKLFGQLRLKEHPVDKKRVIITGSDRILNNGQKLIQSLKNLVLSFEGAEIDFGTGNVYAADGITILGVNFTPATIGASEYLNYSVTIIPSAVNVDNTITAQIIALPADSSNAVKASAPRAVFAKGIQLGQVTVQENAGNIQDISQADISQLGTGGGSGTGTGDANSFTENLKHRLTGSYYEYVTPVVFETDEENLTDSATASYSIVDGVYKFSAAGQDFVSINMFDTEFLGEDHDSRQVELHAEWFSDATRDDSATYEASLDGTNYETLTMVRQGYSQKFTGSKQLAIPSSVSIAAQSSGSTSTELDSSTIQSFSAPITISSKYAVNQFTIQIDKLGSPAGSYTVSFCKDDSGVPGDIIYSRIFLNSTLSSGINSLTINDFRAVLVPGTYHIVIGTDATYKAGFSTGVTSISAITTASGGDDLVFDGSSWSVGSVDLKYSLLGHAYDLRVRVTASGSDKKLKAFGIFYDEQVEFLGETTKALQQFSFSGDLNTTSFSITNFLPNSDLLKVYDTTTGQVYRSPAFSISGSVVTFSSGTFLAPGETVVLLFDQIESSGFGEVTFSGGAGGGGGVDNVDSLLVQNFDSASLGDFTQTGLSLSTSNVINGTQSARLIHQAASSRSFNQVIAVDRKYRGDLMNLSLQVRSSATSGNLTILVTDETNAATIMASSSISTGQYQVATAVTNTTTTISGFSNVDINTLKVGMTITGSGIPTATVINSINAAANTIVISQAATASATITAKFSALPDRKTFSFVIPTNCASLSYTVTALQEAGLPESYVDDVVIELANVSLLETSVTVPVLVEGSYTPSTNVTTNVTATGKYKQIGNTLNLSIGLSYTGAPSAHATMDIDIPSGYTIDTTFLASSSADRQIVGHGRYFDIAGGTTPWVVQAFYLDTNTIRVNYVLQVSGASTIVYTQPITNASPFTPSNGAYLTLQVSVPVTASASSSVAIPLTQSGLVQEGDSSIRASGTGVVSTTQVATLTNIIQNIGSAISFSATNGTYTVNKTGQYSFTFGTRLDASSDNNFVGLSVNQVSALTTTPTGLAVGERLNISGDRTNTAVVNAKTVSVSWTGVLTAGDVVRAIVSSTAYADGWLTASYQGSLKQVAVNTNSKITIPTSELRFEGASTRGSTDTAIVKFNTQAKIRGDAFSIVNTAANGTVITMLKAGRLDVSASLSGTLGSSTWISRNQAVLTTVPVLSEAIAVENVHVAGNFVNIKGTVDVNVGDVIRVAQTSSPSGAFNNFNLSFQEQEIQVSVSNTLPQFSESDSCVRLFGANGYGSTNTTTRRFTNVIQNIGTDIEYIDSATLGGQFIAKAAGIYNVSFSEQSNANLSVMFVAIRVNGSDVAVDNQVYNTAAALNKTASTSWQGYLNIGDIVSAAVNAAAENNGLYTSFTMSKVGKPNVTGVNVTPFVNVPQPVSQSSYVDQVANFGAAAITGALTKSVGSNIYSYNSSTGVYTVLKAGQFNISAMLRAGSAASVISVITINNVNIGLATSLPTAFARATASFSGTLQVGDTFYVSGGAAVTSDEQKISVLATAASDSILTAPETFSTDTASLQYASSAAYTLSTLANAPVGTFITFSYATSTNTRTQTTTAPTQTTADMNANGILLYTRAYTATSTAAQPAAIAIQIGKGLKGKSLDLYKSAGKVNSGSLDMYGAETTTYTLGVHLNTYNESTGILLVDAGYRYANAAVNCFLLYADGTVQTSGYLVINASKNPALTGLGIDVPIAAKMYCTSGQSIANGANSKVVFNVLSFSKGNINADIVNGKFNIQKEGQYRISSFIMFNSAAFSAPAPYGMSLYKNGVFFAYLFYKTLENNTTGFLSLLGTTTLYMNVGDYVEIYVNNSTGAAKSIYTSGETSDFCIEYVGK